MHGARRMSNVSWQRLDPGLFVVRYARSEDLEPARQAALLSAVKEEARQRRTAIVFVVGSAVRIVSRAVPEFWLGVTASSTVGLAAMAIVSSSAAVRVAASSFGVANTLRRVPVKVSGFDAEEDAVTWARARLAQRSGARPARCG